LAVVAIIVLITVLGSATSTYFLFVPKSITTLPASTVTQTTQQLVTALVPTTVTQTAVETVVQTSSIYLSPEQVEYVNQVTGLQLQLATNVSVIFSNPHFKNESGAILVLISLFNTLPTVNNITAAKNWALSDLSAGMCSNFNQPYGIEIMQGYYTKSNVTSATPLPLFQAAYCPVYFPPAFFLFDPQSFYVNTIAFPKTSVSTTISSPGLANESGPHITPLGDAEREIPLVGYCCTELLGTQNCTCITYGQIPFAVGTYTVAGGDEWGDLVLLHFTVLP